VTNLVPKTEPVEAGDLTRYRASYLVHRKITNLDRDTASNDESCGTELIGTVGFRCERGIDSVASSPLSHNTDLAAGILRAEVGYSYLASAWGQGFATEAAAAAVRAYSEGLLRRGYGSKEGKGAVKKVWVEAIVAPEHSASQRVLEKVGLERMGLHEWDGEAAFLAGEWRDPGVLVYGMWIE
jgi:RimJ/RimL family protein N-acetyltransferase